MSTQTDTTNRYGSEIVVCKMRVRVKKDYYINWGLCNLPTFKLPGPGPIVYCVTCAPVHSKVDYCRLI